MEVRHLITILASMTASTMTFAAGEAEALFKQNNCNMCHEMTSSSLGPSLKDIAAKYAKVKGAQAQLEVKVRHGGKGSFGPMPMPATSNSVSNEEIKVMISWILTQN